MTAALQILTGDCRSVMTGMEPQSVDAVVTDPPYALGFMGMEWDRIGDTGRGARVRSEREAEVTPKGKGHDTSAGPYLAAGVDSLRSAGHPFQAWCQEWGAECLRVLRPGGHLVAFGGTRTFHRLTCGLEDAGFEIRDCLTWLYGSGFPKSLDVSKAIDKEAGAERDIIASIPDRWAGKGNVLQRATPESRAVANSTAPATDEARQWQGWGTALKPSWEPIVLARKPLTGTVAANVLTHETGALNIDGCRIGEGGQGKWSSPRGGIWQTDSAARGALEPNGLGRWPANVLLDEDAAEMLDEQSGESRSTKPGSFQREKTSRGLRGGEFGQERSWMREPTDLPKPGYGDSGGASRFFYTAKASGSERGRFNDHPTVKPVSLMRWLVRLITPPHGLILDPFAGSGTTGIAALMEGFSVVLIEQEPKYADLIRRRCASVQQPLDFSATSEEESA